MWSKKKPSNSNFVKRRAQQFVPVLIFGVDKKLAFERWSDFRLEKKLFYYTYKYQGGLDYF